MTRLVVVTVVLQRLKHSTPAGCCPEHGTRLSTWCCTRGYLPVRAAHVTACLSLAVFYSSPESTTSSNVNQFLSCRCRLPRPLAYDKNKVRPAARGLPITSDGDIFAPDSSNSPNDW
ncbi:unnamed protein product, partial [Ectocarpus sp. 13 AM-2016]